MGTAGQSVTLANSIIGVGILAMPFCFQQCGAVLAALMLLLSGLVSRLSCYYLLKSAIIARRRNFEFLAFHVFGAPGKLLVEIAIIGFLMGTCIAYFVVVGDLGPQIISKMFNINQSNVLRTCVMVLVSLVCVLPLGLLRNVDSLSNVSAATIGFYVCLILKVMAEATSQLFTGDWWNKIELWKPEGVLQTMPVFSMALFCQTQLFEIFETLPSLSLEKVSVVTKNALNICTVVYLLVGTFGYIAFCGQQISGNILVSLSPTMASDVIKLGFVMSLAFSFPLIIFPCRASLYSLLYKKVLPPHHDHMIDHSIPEGTFRCITVGIIAISLFISLMMPSIELVLGLVGSTIGVMICVIFPAACFINLTIKNTNERLLAKIVLCVGLIIMILGTYANLEAADNKAERYDDKYITQDKIDKIVSEFLESNSKNIKYEEVIKHPEEKPPEENKNTAIDVAADKESAMQPPNPVAPYPKINENDNVKTIPKSPTLAKPISVKVINGNPAENEIEGAGDKDAGVSVENKKSEPQKDVNALKEAVKDKVEQIVSDLALNQDKLKIIKQQALIDTIKQHGEEQKELIKEQKEILDELKKTKIEMEIKKKESIVKEQANKIAVESIQKIANIAIQSLTGVEENKLNSDNLVLGAENKSIHGDASEILQNAVENIEKIVKEVIPKESSIEVNNHLHVNENKILHKDTADVGIAKLNDHNTQIIQNYSNFGNQLQSNHVHSPDEPKSYVHGEDTKIFKGQNLEHKLSPSKIDALLNNIPVPIVMSKNFENNLLNRNDSFHINIKSLEVEVKKSDKSINQDNSLLAKEKNNDRLHSREKRYTDEKKQCVNLNKQELLNNGVDIKIPQKLSVPDDLDKNIDLSGPRNVDMIVLSYQSRKLKSLNDTGPS